MEKTMNKENKWYSMVETDIAEEPVQKLLTYIEAMKKIKSGKATRSSKVSVEMIASSGEIGVKVIIDLFPSILGGRGKPDEWKTNVIVPIFTKKGDVLN